MKFKLQCVVPDCKQESIWVRGEVESDTNALNLDENDKAWEDACIHIKEGGDYDIVDEEPIGEED